MMYTVKLTFNYDFPVMRQTPASGGVWGDYRFVIDDALEECDYWIIYSAHNFSKTKCKVDKRNIIFLPAEAYDTSPRFSPAFLAQFGKVITVQPQMQGENIIHWQNANPWFIEKSYDELKAMSAPAKTKLLSIVSSNKDFTEGHRLRIQFAQKLVAHFGDRIDFFGRGFRDFENKWDVLAPYQYHIAIENDFVDDWVTEKFMDPVLSYTFPFYYGCPNLGKYMPEGSFERIDIHDVEKSIRIIENAIASHRYESFVASAEYREVALDQQQLFPMLVKFLREMNPGKKSWQTINPPGAEDDTFFRKVKRKIKQINKQA